MSASNIIYILDDKNRIVSVGGAWNKFADENDGINLTAKDIFGRQIWDFVTGDATRMWLEVIFQLARFRGTRVERPYRCDSPKLKRYMRMYIDPEHNKHLLVSHEILAVEERSAPLYIRYGPNSLKNIRQRCSVCGRLNIGGWQEPQAKHTDASNSISVSYTICNECQQTIPGI